MAAAVAVGCGGGDDESTAKDEPVEVSAAGEPAKTFISRLAKLIETSTSAKDCAELEQINSRSATRFPCPAPQDLRKSMRRFEVVGAEEYGTGAVVDYKSGQIKDGAAIVLFVAPDRNWGVGRFGVVSEPSTETSDEDSREGYAKAVDKYLTAVRERDCDAYFDIKFNGDDKKDVVCKQSFLDTQNLGALLKSNPGVEPRYAGGNESYGFYSLETSKPILSNVTISVAKASEKSSVPYVVLDVTPAPTTALQKRAQKAFEKSQRQKGTQQDMTPSSKPSDPAVTTP
jgi:hypothetical protein